MAAKPQYYCASLVLAKEFDAVRSYSLYPVIADSFVFGKIARGGNNQLRPNSIEKRVGARTPGMVLAFNDNVTVQIQAVSQQRALGFKAAVGHEQNRSGWRNGQLDNIGLIVCDGSGKYAWRIKNLRGDLG